MQSVKISNFTSSSIELKYGVPQGSILGPLLFLIYINDLTNSIIYSELFHFADDTSLLYSSHDLKKIKKHVNIDLKFLFKWLNSNKISLNIAKTEAILFKHPNKCINYNLKLKLNGNVLQFVDTVRYLGVLLDHHLTWIPHTNSIASKLNKANGMLSILRHYLPKSSLIDCYHALFASHATFSCQIWGQSISNTHRIIKLQKAALRVITFSDFRQSSIPLLSQCKILRISDFITLSNILLVFNILNSLTPNDVCNLFNLKIIQSTYQTRNSSIKLLNRPVVRTSKFGVNSILYQCILCWNRFQQHFSRHDLASLSSGQIKSKCKLFFLESYKNGPD